MPVLSVSYLKYLMLRFLPIVLYLTMVGCFQDNPVSTKNPEKLELSYSALSGLNNHVTIGSVMLPPSQPVQLGDFAEDWIVARGIQGFTIRRAGVTPQIICDGCNSSFPSWAPPNGMEMRWSGGTHPYPSGSSRLGTKVAGNNLALITVTGQGQPKKLTLFVSVTNAKGKLSVSMPGGNILITREYASSSGTKNYLIEVRYRSFSNFNVDVAWFSIADYGNGAVTLYGAATETYANTAPSISIKTPPIPQDWDRYMRGYALPLQLESTPTDMDGLRGVEWWRNTTKIAEVTTPPYNLPNHIENVPGINEYRAVVVDKFGAASSSTTKIWEVWEWVPMYNGNYISGPIPDNNSFGISFSYYNQSNRIIDKVNLRMWATHSSLGQLRIKLRGPDNREIRLTDRTGGNQQVFYRTVFNDEAPLSIADPSAVEPYTGNYRPIDQLWNFRGMSSQGNWVANYVDLVPGGTGTAEQTYLYFLYR